MEMTQTDPALRKSVSRRTWRQLNRGQRWQWPPGGRILDFSLRYGTEKAACVHRKGSLHSFKSICQPRGGGRAASVPRGSQQLVSLRPRRENKPGEGWYRKRGACGQRGRRFPLESHGEPGCGSAKLNLCGRANWIGIARIAAGAIRGAPWTGGGTAPHRYGGEPTGVNLPPSQWVLWQSSPRGGVGQGSTLLKYDQGCLDASAAWWRLKILVCTPREREAIYRVGAGPEMATVAGLSALHHRPALWSLVVLRRGQTDANPRQAVGRGARHYGHGRAPKVPPPTPYPNNTRPPPPRQRARCYFSSEFYQTSVANGHLSPWQPVQRLLYFHGRADRVPGPLRWRGQGDTAGVRESERFVSFFL